MSKPITLEDFEEDQTSRLPFITGSQAYGNPGPESDVDLVILLNEETLKILDRFNENIEATPAVRFGKLNLITLTTEATYDAWKEATDSMREVKEKTGAGFPKEVASKKIQDSHKKRGLPFPEFGVSD